MHLPVVAIVGRPNVGKSTLLNALSGRLVSVVDPTEGVTRDRVTVRARIEGRACEMVDTGGIGIVDRQDLGDDVEAQIGFALGKADVILFVVDVRAGVTPLDREVARRLHELGKPVQMVVNKVESLDLERSVDEFRSLGMGGGIAVSAQNRENLGELARTVAAMLPEDGPTHLPDTHVEVAIVGRQNAGKSTLVNRIARDDRVIVSEKPGTTRDAVDVHVERSGRTWVLIDTAGIVKRSHSRGDAIQWYSEHRAFRSVRRADVTILLLDATRNVGSLEKKIASEIEQAGKPCLLVANKWDLVEGQVRTGTFEEYFRQILPGLVRAPLAFVSAETGLNVQAMLDVCADLHRQACQQVPTADVNGFVKDALEHRSPRIRSSRRPKIYYATQVGVAPPTIALFVNDPKLFDPAFRRYMEHRFREVFPFPEVPVRLHFRKRDRKSLGDLKGGAPG